MPHHLELIMPSYYDLLKSKKGDDINAIEKKYKMVVDILLKSNQNKSAESDEINNELIKLNEAFDALKDVEKRRAYDETVSANAFSDLYAILNLPKTASVKQIKL